jgi:hypothetical protein
MKTITLTAIAALTFATAADAAPITFEADGVTWTVVEGGNGAPMTALHIPPGTAKKCPSHTVKLVAVSPNEGPAMTAEQKSRGDARWRMVCVRTTPQ